MHFKYNLNIIFKGSLSDDQKIAKPLVLYNVRLKYINDSVCMDDYFLFNPDKQICAGDLVNSKDTCYGKIESN